MSIQFQLDGLIQWGGRLHISLHNIILVVVLTLKILFNTLYGRPKKFMYAE